MLVILPCSIHYLSFLFIQDYLSGCVGEVRWSSSLYPDLYTPSSPSWSLHWTYRDSQLVNLPVSLLVEGDVIALRPGQEAFASLRGIKVSLCSCSAICYSVIYAFENVFFGIGVKRHMGQHGHSSAHTYTHSITNIGNIREQH